MIKSRKDLEERVLEYSPKIRERIERDPRARETLDDIAGKEYETYKPFIGGASQKVGSVGRVLGYTGDLVFWGSALAATVNPLLAPYMLTGLLLKKGHLMAQAPEAVRTAKYVSSTGDVKGGARNIGGKLISYLPGATVVDKGLGQIAEEGMVRSATYKINEALGEEGKSWYRRAAEDAEKAGYTAVKVRSENIIRPDFKQQRKKVA